MFNSFKTLIPAIALLSNNLFAATMSFDRLTANGATQSIYVENGITASGSPSVFTNPGAAHLDDFGTPFFSQMDFSMDSLFTAISFDVIDLNRNTFSNLGTAEGFLDGALVASISFSSVPTVILPSTFTGLDTFSISVTERSDLFNDTGCAPCNHFDIDNIILSPYSTTPPPVPLPAGFPLMASALAVLGLFRLDSSLTEVS